MINFLSRSLNVLVSPIILLDSLGALVGFVWLAIYGEWGIILAGIFWLFVSIFTISFFLLPSLVLGAPVIFFAKRNNIIGLLFFGFLSVSYVAIIIYVSCAWIFEAFTSEIPIGNSAFPYLLWSYAIATAPWAYMASKEDESATGSILALFFTKLGLLCVVLLTGFFNIELSSSLTIFALFMIIEVIVALFFSVLIANDERRSKSQHDADEHHDLKPVQRQVRKTKAIGRVDAKPRAAIKHYDITRNEILREDDELIDWDSIKNKE